MANQAIHFGTSGWRGIIADDFTFSGVRRAAAAIAGHVRAQKKSPVLIIGYDTRFFSEEFALAAASVLRAHGCRILFCREATPTPTIAHAILHGKLDGGVNITASHNPAAYNGLKFSGPDGGPALPEITRDIEKRAAAIPDEPAPRDHDERENDFERIDPREPYFEQLRRMVRFDVLRTAKGSFVCDAVHGCGAGWLDRILTEGGVAVTSIRAERDVLFEGTGPDPSEQNLAALKKVVTDTRALAGLATDGDADRFGIVDRDGSFVSPNHILGLVFDYLLETRGYKLGASRSVATTHLLDAVARLHGVQLYETPVGFKYVGPLLRDDKIAIGGEESAGMTIRGHLPEKDGILACLLVAEMIAARQSSLADQLGKLFRRVGREFWPIRVNLHLPQDVQGKLPKRLHAEFKEFAGRRVAHTNRVDGLKLIFEDGDWLLMRPSGTEPVVRVYTEAATPAASQKLAEKARAWVTQ
ncbi:MAG TPA: phosphoglucomutase/phosphomannomutase family protein [Candidatus Polarisedimenticolia bacterium]|nr:phosphoglucomutase/phosphomannomutase family protein [Candidatus Polarisedimenticolia bacterium]